MSIEAPVPETPTGACLLAVPANVSATYLQACLASIVGRTPGAVTEVTVARLGKGTSGDELYTVRALADGAPVRLVLKLNQPDEVAETLFYRDLAHRLAVDTPRVADARVLDDGRGWVLMEDIQAKDDLTWTEEEYRAIVADMAAMHATCWNSPALDAYRWLWRPTREAVREIMGGLGGLAATMQSSLPESLAPIFGGGRLARIVEMLNRSDELMGPLLKAGMTLVHGDYWFHNVLLTDDGRRTLIDWQGCRIFSGIWEICYFVDLLRAVGPREFRELPLPEEQIIDWYREGLRRGGISLSDERFADLYRRARILQPLVHWFRLTGSYLMSDTQAVSPEGMKFLTEEFDRWDRDVEQLAVTRSGSYGGD